MREAFLLLIVLPIGIVGLIAAASIAMPVLVLIIGLLFVYAVASFFI